MEKLIKLSEKELLIRSNARGNVINKVYTENPYKQLDEIFCLGDTPLIELNIPFCPTCTATIAIATGREGGFFTPNLIGNFDKDIDEIESILSLLEDNYYVIKECELCPTDGEGEFFWNISSKGKEYFGSSDIFYDGNYVPSFIPKFLIPSQRTDSFNKDRVEYYREKLRNGEELRGIAYYIRGCMCLLIDGHHKATAAYLEGKRLKCLTIIECYYSKCQGEKKLHYLDKEIKIDDVKNYQEITGFYDNYIKQKKIIKYKDEERNDKLIEIEKIESFYPSYKDVALATLVEDYSETFINKCLNYKGEDPKFELKCLLSYFIENNEERARQLSFQILEKIEFESLWYDAIWYLSNYKDERVEDAFIDILVRYDSSTLSEYEGLKNVIDKYFKQ